MTSTIDGPRRLEQLDERGEQISEEILAIEDGEVAETTITPNGEFDHREWLLAELQETDEQMTHTQALVTVEGEVRY